MSYSIKYKELFSVKILHRYFLDKGTEKFSMMAEAERLKQLGDYNFQSAVSIVPTAKTHQKMNGRKLIFRTHSAGFTVWSKVAELDDKETFIALDDDLFFTFIIQTKHALFYNYTDLKLENIGKTYYMANRALVTESNNFPLIDTAGSNSHIDEGFILSAEAEKNELEKLGVGEQSNMLGIIRIFMQGAENSLSVTTTQGKLRVTPREFEVVFKNRNSFWRYLFDKDQTVTAADNVMIENGDAKQLVTKTEQPLTQHGFISVKLANKELPNPDVRSITPGTSNKYYSEIYM